MDKKKYATYTDINEEHLTWDVMKLILDNSFDEIYVLDHTGKIVYVNNVSTLHYGVLPGELIGKNYKYLHDNHYCDPPVFPVVIKEKKTVVMDQRTSTGRKLTVTATPVFDENGNIEYIVMNSRDISGILSLKRKLVSSLEKQEKYKNAMLHHQEEDRFISQSRAMRECYAIGSRVSRVDSGVLILGESGVGKSFLARHIHNQSDRKEEAFITLNCATIPGELLESELFGYKKGAFSGADSKGKSGLAMVANKGTLFLDEIGELPYEMQAKILRLVQEHCFIPLGGTKEVHVDIKIIAATNRDLKTLVEQGAFRSDLYYRLNVIKIEIPALKERKEDILPLIRHFLAKFNRKYKTQKMFSPDADALLQQYSWPGNVREIENVVERLVIITDGDRIERKDLPPEIAEAVQPEKNEASIGELPLHIPTKSEEKNRIIEKYIELRSTYKVAKELHVSQSKVARIVKKYREEENLM